MRERSTSRPPRKSSRRNRRTRPTRGAISRRCRCSATRTCTRRSPWMPARSAPGSTPKDAYRFARGEEIISNTGQPVKLSRPLDFLVVADHSDGMGFFPQLMSGDPELLATPQGRKWYDQIQRRQGRRGGVRHHHELRQGHDAQGVPDSGNARPIAAPGRKPSRRRRPTTSRAASPRSSATSGPRTPAATTCTATSSSAATAPRPAWSSPSPRCSPWAATTPRTCGSGWRPRRRRPAARCWPSPTTAT